MASDDREEFAECRLTVRVRVPVNGWGHDGAVEQAEKVLTGVAKRASQAWQDSDGNEVEIDITDRSRPAFVMVEVR